MGSMTINPKSPLLAGAAITKTDTGGTTSTILVAATTAQSSLNCDNLFVVFDNYATAQACVVTLKAGVGFSEIGQGAAAAITVATGTTVVFGGADFESARFLNASGQLDFTITTAATVYVYAVMKPFVEPNV